MAARPQFTMDERNFLAFEYHKYRGTRGFVQRIFTAFQLRFPGTRVPGQHQMRLIWEKQMGKGTVNNCNSKASPGPTYSGRPRTARTPANAVAVKAVMDRDAAKEMGDATVSPVSTSRINVLGLDKSAWWRTKVDLRWAWGGLGVGWTNFLKWA